MLYQLSYTPKLRTPAPPWYHGDGPGTVWIPPGWRLVEE